jgi:hypothetical protein
MKIQETELYLPVKNWLEDQGFEVFPEVQLHWGMNIVDIIGIHKPLTIAVELKTSFSLAVIEQAINNRLLVHKSYVAVPYFERIIRNGKYVEGSDHRLATNICRENGIGVLRLHFDRKTNNYKYLEEIQPAKLSRKWCVYQKQIIAICDENRKKFNEENNIVAGAKGGGYLTDYKKTIQNVINFLKDHNKATAKEICDNIDYHYNGYNPASQLYKSLTDFEMDKFYITRENNKTYFSLKDGVK